MTAEHWQQAYENAAQHSWDQATAGADLSLLEQAGLSPEDSVIDVGGGDGAFTEALLHRGHVDLTVLDIARSALDAGRRRAGSSEEAVDWIRADVRTWRPERTWRVWHDRAAFHFLTSDEDRAAYGGAVALATAPGSLVCVGTFAEDGPTHCSGLPVERYTASRLGAELGGLVPGLEPVATADERHRTPTGAEQPFVWVLLRRSA